MLQLVDITQVDAIQFAFPERMFLPTIQTEHNQGCVSLCLCLLNLCCCYLARESTEDIGLEIFEQIPDLRSSYSSACRFLYVNRGIPNGTPSFG